MIIKKEITKEEISKMPRETFDGKIIVVETEETLKKAIKDLTESPEVGFDTETRPSFSKRKHYKMSLIQLSSDDTCYLIRLNKFNNVPPLLESFLKNESIKKIGISLLDDFHGLHSITDITPANFIDLQKFVSEFNIKDMSLQKIYAILFNKKISKRERLSNWAAETLTEAQQQYAALDAWACLHIYQYLNSQK